MEGFFRIGKSTARQVRIQCWRTAVTVLTVAVSIQAEGVGYNRYVDVTPQSGELFGMEIEIAGERNLGNLFSVFDLNVSTFDARNIADHLSTVEMDAYLTPSTLEALPASVRDQLTQGIELGGKIAVDHKPVATSSFSQETPKPATNPPPARTASGLIVPSRILNPGSSQSILLSSSLSNATQSPSAQTELIVESKVRSEAAWNSVLARWKQLDGRQALIDPNRLHRTVRARLVLSEAIPARLLKVRADAPAKVKELFSRLEWNFEPGGHVEFRHKMPVSDPEKFHADRELFSDVAGIRRYIDDPLLPVPDDARFSYHWHGSKHGSSLNDIIPIEKRLRLIDMALAGRADSMLNSDSMHAFDGMRGPVILARQDHIESRQHGEPPRAEFERIRRLMNLPAKEAVAEAERHLAKKSSVLQTHILNSLTSGAPARDAQNELAALLRADPDGATTFVRQNRSTLITNLPLSNRNNLVTPQTVSTLLPLYDSNNAFLDGFETVFRSVLHSSDPLALEVLEETAKKAGIKPTAMAKMISTELNKVVFSASGIQEASFETAVKLIRTYGFSDSERLITRFMSACADPKCLTSILDSLDSLLEPPTMLSTRGEANIRKFIFQTPVGKEILGRVKDGRFLFYPQLDLLLTHGSRTEEEMIKKMLFDGTANGPEAPRVLAKLIALEHPITADMVATTHERWSHQHYPEDWEVVNKSVSERLAAENLNEVTRSRSSVLGVQETLDRVRLTEILKSARSGKYISPADVRFLLKFAGPDEADAIDLLLRKGTVHLDNLDAALAKLIDLKVPISTGAISWVRSSWSRMRRTQRATVEAALIRVSDHGNLELKKRAQDIAKGLKISMVKIRTKHAVAAKLPGCAAWFRGLLKK